MKSEAAASHCRGGARNGRQGIELAGKTRNLEGRRNAYCPAEYYCTGQEPTQHVRILGISAKYAQRWFVPSLRG